MGIKIDKKSFKEKYIKDKTKRPPMGLRIYTAPQGGGKTLSMVHDAIKLLEEFPKMKVVTNLKLNVNVAQYYFQGAEGLKKALRECKNGQDGVLMIVDEFQLFASKKSGVPIEVFQALCQQRKQRRFMMGTAQDWEDVDVSTRKKVKEIVQCNTKFGKIQINSIFDGYSIRYDKRTSSWECTQIGTEIFKHNKKLYDAYDTFAEVSSNQDIFIAPKAPVVQVQVTEQKQRR